VSLRGLANPTGIYVDINRDHIFVTEALKAKPVNRAALNLMIVSEIATLLIEHPDMLENAFKPSVVADLEACEAVTRYGN
jgi:hypothetical protein